MTTLRRRLLALLILPALAFAQDSPFTAGRAHFNDQQYDKAVEQFTKATQADTSNGQAYFWLGLSHYQTRAYATAEAALRKAEDLGTFRGFTRFAIARCAARLGRADDAFAWLEKAAGSGFTDLNRFDGEEAFASLKSHPRYAMARETIDKAARPTEYDARYRQLDFWIGAWDVFDRSGTRLGGNIITKELNGAILLEQWTSANGGIGSSINFYDSETGLFKQQWVSQDGSNTKYEGKLENGAMVMYGRDTDRQGTVSHKRMTFTPNADGSVTQLIENTTDGGTTWNREFEGIYRKSAGK